LGRFTDIDTNGTNSLISHPDGGGAIPLSRARLFLGFGIVTMAFVMYEARFGYALGVSLDICRAVGGKKATNPNRCITRTCFWFGDCGTWPSPGVYRENLAIGDPVSKAIFWLGDPARIEGTAYVWPIGKGEAGDFRVTFENGRIVHMDR
jgi:hypothetical protein